MLWMLTLASALIAVYFGLHRWLAATIIAALACLYWGRWAIQYAKPRAQGS